MDPAAFEQLLNEWLDQPERTDLRARIEAIAAENPDLARLRDQWLRLNGLLQTVGRQTPAVDWDRFRRYILAESETARQTSATNAHELDAPDTADAALDTILGRLPNIVEERIDWQRFQAHVQQAIRKADGQTNSETPHRTIRFPRRKTTLAVLSVLAAAAALVFLVRIPRDSWRIAPSLPPLGVARVAVQSVAAEVLPPQSGTALVNVATLIEPVGQGLANQSNEARLPEKNAVAVAEVFLMVEPAPAPRVALAQADDLGF